MPALHRARMKAHASRNEQRGSACEVPLPPCRAQLLRTLSASMASINYRGVEADDEHMAGPDRFTAAWWVMLTWCGFLSKRLSKKATNNVTSMQGAGPLSAGCHFSAVPLCSRGAPSFVAVLSSKCMNLNNALTLNMHETSKCET